MVLKLTNHDKVLPVIVRLVVVKGVEPISIAYKAIALTTELNNYMEEVTGLEPVHGMTTTGSLANFCLTIRLILPYMELAIGIEPTTF